jgi:hypothetical protein
MKKVKLQLTFDDVFTLAQLLRERLNDDEVGDMVVNRMTRALVAEVFMKLQPLSLFRFDRKKSVTLTAAQGLAVWQIWRYQSIYALTPFQNAVLSQTIGSIHKNLLV